MKTIHYSQQGYEGNFMYKSVCGKNVKSHQDNQESSIHPEQANCQDCLNSLKYQADLFEINNINPAIKRRIYIESDILHADEFREAQRTAYVFAKDQRLACVGRVFSEVLDFAWHDLETTWDAVKKADEIWATSSLMPLTGGSYNGAPVIFNGMCERSIKENVTGKSVIILNSLDRIYWDLIKKPIMKQAFENNDLYMYNDEYELEKVDISTIV